MAAYPVRLLSLLTATLATACGGPATTTPDTSIGLEPCRLRGTSGMSSVAAECGRLTLPQNPADPDGEQIDLFVARLPAIAPSQPATAFTVLAGGPGQAASEFFADYAPAFEQIRRFRDVILVDQRGTGRSNALECDYDIAATLDFSPAAAAQQGEACLRSLPADPRFYTTSVAVADLDRVRAALGYRQFDIYGISYGTRVALHYLRRHPDRARTVTVDGVIAADQLVGPDIALAAQAALDAIFARCREDQACGERFPAIETDFASLQQALRETPRQIRIADPASGEPIDVTLSYDAFSGAVRLLSYAPATAALLPLVLQQAAADGNYAPLAAQAQIALGSLAESLSEGMHNAVVCTEDVPFFDIDAAHRTRLRQTYLGETLIDALAAICSVWPAGVIDSDFHAPLSSEVPVLLMSGTADPVTPPANGERAAATLANSAHVVAEGHGHGVLGLACVPGLLASFVEQGSLEELDTDCVAGNRPAPFFLRFTGPDP